MSKPNVATETLRKVARGLELEEAGHSQAAIAEHLGYKNAGSWTAMRRMHHKNARHLMYKVGIKPHISESPHVVPKTDNTAKPDPLLLQAQSNRVEAEVRKSIVDTHPAPPVDPQVSLRMSMRINMEGRHLSYLSDGKTLGIRAKGSKEKYMYVPLHDAGAFIEELKQAIRAAQQGAEVTG